MVDHWSIQAGLLKERESSGSFSSMARYLATCRVGSKSSCAKGLCQCHRAPLDSAPCSCEISDEVSRCSTMRFGCTAKVLAECKLKYSRISERAQSLLKAQSCMTSRQSSGLCCLCRVEGRLLQQGALCSRWQHGLLHSRQLQRQGLAAALGPDPLWRHLAAVPESLRGHCDRF